MREGFGFHWEPYERPYLISPSGKKITLEISHEIPILPDGFVSAALQQTKGDSGAAIVGSKPNIDRGNESPAPIDGDEEHLLTHLPKKKRLRHLPNR